MSATEITYKYINLLMNETYQLFKRSLPRRTCKTERMNAKNRTEKLLFLPIFYSIFRYIERQRDTYTDWRRLLPLFFIFNLQDLSSFNNVIIFYLKNRLIWSTKIKWTIQTTWLRSASICVSIIQVLSGIFWAFQPSGTKSTILVVLNRIQVRVEIVLYVVIFFA
jgi:hypothetical protein